MNKIDYAVYSVGGLAFLLLIANFVALYWIGANCPVLSC
jgi:hypothetical protein